MRIGAAEDNDLVLPYPTVSRHHAVVAAAPGGLFLKDLGSKNGLVSEGRSRKEILLRPGVTIRLGDVFVAVEEISSSEVELGLELERGSSSSAPDRGSASTNPVMGASAADAIRWAREIDLAGDIPDSDPRRARALEQARLILGAEALVLFRMAAKQIALTDLAGALPDMRALEDLSDVLEETCTPERRSNRPRWITTGTADDDLHAAMRARSCTAWQTEFLEYVRVVMQEPQTSGPDRPAAIVDDLLKLPSEMVIGSSAAIRSLLDQLRATVRSHLDILLVGETGTGKELLARVIHASGLDAKGPFIAVNCAAIPNEMLEAELFGIRDKVATGVARRTGLFVEANHGTIFLDEIGDMPEKLQAKLLRVLQEREVVPVGQTKPVKLDLRVVSSTNHDLERLVREGTFRRDLYYRLAGVQLTIPPLRDRPEDIPGLVLDFLSRTSHRYDRRLRGVSRAALARLTEHDWPGNIRELKSEIDRAILVCPRGGTLQTEHLSPALATNGVAGMDEEKGDPAPDTLVSHIEALERDEIAEALRRAKGNKSEAARLLGISRAGLYKKLSRLERDE